jgi:hypothetical protein
MADAPLPSESAIEECASFINKTFKVLQDELGMGAMTTLTKVINDKKDGKYDDQGPEFLRGMDAVLNPVSENIADREHRRSRREGIRMIVKLQWDTEDLGPDWMNIDNLKTLLYSEESTSGDLLKAFVLNPAPAQMAIVQLLSSSQLFFEDNEFNLDEASRLAKLICSQLVTSRGKATQPRTVRVSPSAFKSTG